MLYREKYRNITHSIALRLRRICDSDKKFKHRSEEHDNYLIARAYHSGLVGKQLQNVEMTSRHNARKKNTKRKEVCHIKFITIFNPALPSIGGLIENTFTIYIQIKFLKRSFQIISFLLFMNVTKT